MSTDQPGRVEAITDRSFLEQSPVAVSLMGLDGSHVDANQAFFDLMGLDRSVDLATVRAHDLTHPDDRGDVADYLPDLIAGTVDLFTVEKRYVRPDGTVVWAELNASPVRNDAGEVTHIMGVILDITEQHETREALLKSELARLSENEQAVNAAAATFVAMVGHELRTPLNAIVGLSELLAANDLSTEDANLVRSIRRESQTLRLVVDDLLDYSKIEVGRLRIKEEAFSPSRLLLEVADVVHSEAERKTLDLTVDVDPRCPVQIVADSLRLRQILVNLASNAVRHTNDGTVELSIEVTGRRELTFRVADTGKGIAEDELPTLFDAFVQAGDGRVGAGLGLAISDRLTSLLGGSIHVESTVGEGSTFSVKIPWSDSLPVGERVSADRATPTTQAQAHVLVAEDSGLNRDLVKAQLERLGMSCTAVADGPSAVEVFETQPFDLVLTDLYMPGLDGIEVARQIRRIEERQGVGPVPIVAFTGSSLDGNRERLLEAGLSDFLLKPVGLEELDEMLGRWLRPSNVSVGVTPPRGGVRPIDYAQLDQLVKDLGGKEAATPVIARFLGELDGWMEVISDSPTARTNAAQADKIMRAAHSLRSISALLGAKVLSRYCAQLQDLIEQSQRDGVGVAPPEAVGVAEAVVRTASEVSAALEQRIK